MGVNWFATKFSNIGNQTALRFDPKYRKFWDVNKGNFISSKNSIPSYEILEEIKVTKLKKGELNEGYYLLNIADQQPKIVFLENLEEVYEIGSDKNPLWESDIIISKLGLPKGYIFLNDKEKFPKLIGSSELIPYKLKSDKYLPKFIVYFLLLDNVLKCFSALESGRTPSHKRVSPNDLLKTNFPLVLKENQERLLRKIEPLEDQIKHLKSQIEDPLAIINEVFAKEFRFDANKFNSLVKTKIYKIRIKEIGMSNLLRTTYKYNHPACDYLRRFLASSEFQFLNKILKEPIHRGIQPEYNDEGVKVIKTGTIQKGSFDYSEVEYVSEEFYEKNKVNAGIQYNDLLLTSTGMGRGKFALYTEEESAIADSHISIIRFDTQKINSLFLSYFCQSILGIRQLDYLESQIKGTPEIYRDQIDSFIIPDISSQKQESIVEKIKSELDKQKEIEREVDEKQKEISRIIEAAIKG